MKKNKEFTPISTLGNNKSKSVWGFTLVEVLVVIAIINILSTVALVVLNGARDKATEAKVKSQLKSMNSQALFYSGSNADPVVGFSASPATIIGDPNGNLFTNTTEGSGSLYGVLSKVPNNSSVYYGSDGKNPSEGGKWFISVETPKGVIATDYTGSIKSWKGDPPETEDEFLALCSNANNTYTCDLPASGAKQCSDGIDNDNDGKIDIQDEYCHRVFLLELEYYPDYDSEDETLPSQNDFPACSDGIDNDNDGKKDIQDEYCHTDFNLELEYDPYYGSENVLIPQCSDSRDNDLDEKTDIQDETCHINNSPRMPYDPERLYEI